MKSLLSTLVLFMLLVQMVSGNWYVRKCANRLGTCRKACNREETMIDPPTGMCNGDKLCCLPSLNKVPLVCDVVPETVEPSPEGDVTNGAVPGAGGVPGTGVPGGPTGSTTQKAPGGTAEGASTSPTSPAAAA